MGLLEPEKKLAMSDSSTKTDEGDQLVTEGVRC